MSATVSLMVMAPGWGALAGGAVLAVNALAAHQRRVLAEQARVSFARAAYTALEARLADDRARFPGLSPLPPPPVGLSAADEAAALEAIVAAGERHLGEQLAGARLDAFAAALRGALAGGSAASSPPGPPAPDSSRPAGTGQPAAAQIELATALADTRRVLARLDPAAPAAARAALAERARDVLAAPPGRRPALLDDLRLAVADADAQAAELRAELAELRGRAIAAGVPAEDLGSPLAPVALEPVSLVSARAAVSAAVSAAEEAARRRAERAHAAAAVREALEELGCEVEESFDTLIVDGAVAMLRPADRTGHSEAPGRGALTVRTRMSERGLRFDAVPAEAVPAENVGPAETAGSDALAAAERAWCDDVETLVPALARRGIPVEIVARSAVGAGDALQVAPRPGGRSARGAFRARTPARRRDTSRAATGEASQATRPPDGDRDSDQRERDQRERDQR